MPHAFTVQKWQRPNYETLKESEFYADRSNWKPTRKYVWISVVKIRVRVISLKGTIETAWKWRMNRGVTSLRPPPGGPIAAQM